MAVRDVAGSCRVKDGCSQPANSASPKQPLSAGEMRAKKMGTRAKNAAGVMEGCVCQVCVVKQMARLAEKGKSLESIGLACSKAFLGNLISLGFTHQIKSLDLITAESLGLGAG